MYNKCLQQIINILNINIMFWRGNFSFSEKSNFTEEWLYWHPILSNLARRYAIFLCFLDVEIYSLVGQLTMSNLSRTNSWRQSYATFSIS